MPASLTQQPNGVLITGLAQPPVLFIPKTAMLHQFADVVRVAGGATEFFIAPADLGVGTVADAIETIAGAMPTDYNTAQYQSGRYIATVERQVRPTNPAAGMGVIALANGTAQFGVFKIAKAVAINQIAIRVVTAEAGKTARLAIAKIAANGEIGEIIHETADFSMAVAGEVAINESFSFPNAGIYAIIAVGNGSTGMLNVYMNGALPLSYNTQGAICNGTFPHTYADPIPDNPAYQSLAAYSNQSGVIAAIFRIA